ncbi:transmembrane channel-like protein 1 [Silurus meridionalis]|uniref:transmembrane channel-like protein 1 n=1 Tax=Silurus meridionalis TaxID=175797 RepID=UPI001EEACB34|nr:transmembrane channel-like protein 1 [Silurus meridionalis]
MTKREKQSKAEKGQALRTQQQPNYLCSNERDGIKRRKERDEIPQERKKSSKIRRTKKQQEFEKKERAKEEEKKLEKNEKKDRPKFKKRRIIATSSDGSSSSDEEFDVDSLSEEGIEKLMKAIDRKKRRITTLRAKPWSMDKKLAVLRKAQAFIEKYEEHIGKGEGRKLYACKVMISKIWVKFQRSFKNFKAACVLWEMKIKKIESHFGSSVASYFILLRWMFGINLISFGLSFGLVMIPEALLGKPFGSIPRKTVSREEEPTAMNLEVLWDVSGYIKYSVLFIGYYNDQRTIGWLKFRMPLCYFLVGLASVAYGYLVIVKAMAYNAGQESGDDNNYKYSWRIFTGWDYLIGNPEAADSKFASNTMTFKEIIVDEKNFRKMPNFRKLLILRTVSNILVLIILVGSGYLIYFVVRRSGKFFKLGMDNFSWWERNEVNVVMSMLSTFGPMMFDAISYLELYHPRINMRWQMGRVFALYTGNLYSFLIGIIDQINISRGAEEQTKHNLTIWEAAMYNKSLAENTTFKINPADVPRGPCWETLVGQEFVRMLLTDTVTFYSVTVINDFARAVFLRYVNPIWCWDLEYTFPCYSEFDLSGNALSLIFNQGMIWIGTFFAPCLPAINLLRLQTFMYLQAWAVLCCNIPPVRIFKASRSSNFYMTVLLVILFLSTMPLVFSLVSMRPSFDCGPFSGKDHFYDVVPETLELDFPYWLKKVVNLILNPGLVLPFILLLVLIIYYLYTMSKNYKQANSHLRKKMRSQGEENRKRTRLTIKKATEYMEKAKKMASTEQPDMQGNNALPSDEKDRSNINEQSSCSPPPPPPPTAPPPPPPHIHISGQGLSFNLSRRPVYTRPPAPRSYLLHGQLPGVPPH